MNQIDRRVINVPPVPDGGPTCQPQLSGGDYEITSGCRQVIVDFPNSWPLARLNSQGNRLLATTGDESVGRTRVAVWRPAAQPSEPKRAGSRLSSLAAVKQHCSDCSRHRPWDLQERSAMMGR
jgi:hypothetical protein